MKILITVYSGWHSRGGTAVSTYLLAENLQQLGHDIWLASVDNYPGLKTFVFFDIRKIPLWFVRDWYLKRFFSRLIKRNKIDLIYASDCRFTAAPAIAAACAAGIKAVVHYRDYWFRCLRGDMLHGNQTCAGFGLDNCYRLQSKKYWLWERYKLAYFKKRLNILKQADLHLAVSQAMAESMAEAGINSKTAVVYDLFDLAAPPRSMVVGSNQLRVLFAGRLEEHRGVKELLAIIKLAAARRERLEFLIAGGGALASYCRNFIRQNKLVNVKMLGALAYEDLLELYGKVDVFLFPVKLAEPLGRVALEAMAAGLPVVASRQGGLAEIISDGVNGYFIKPEANEETLEKLLQFTDQQLLAAMSAAAKERAAQFEQKTIAQKISRLLTDLFYAVH